MLNKLVKRSSRSICSKLLKTSRLYHSFPDPQEVPKISHSKSNHVSRKLKKDTSFSDEEFQIKIPEINNDSHVDFESSDFTHVTKLDNNLTVSSQDMHGLMSSFAFAVGSGSANENDNEFGATQILELSAFSGSIDDTDIISEIEKLGGMVQCISSRESIMYCVDVLKENLEPAMKLLSNVILKSPTNLSEYDIEECKMIMQYQWDELPGEIISRDHVSIAAYSTSSLGKHHFLPLDSLDKLNISNVNSFYNNNFYSENCHLCAAGVNHDEFVALSKKYFNTLKNKNEMNIINKNNDTEIIDHKGGLILQQRELREPFVKVAVGFEVGGWHSTDDNIVAVCVLQQLLGGGSSFSAGGPGKGMYTRLYRELLNRYHWVEGAESFVTVYNKRGILGIDGACKSEDVHKMLQVLLDQLIRLAYEPVSEEELNRAKNMLKSMMLMQLESRLVLCEDITRQMLTYGYRESPSDLIKKIDDISFEDIQNVAIKMIKFDPSIAIIGYDTSNVPTYENIKAFKKAYQDSLQTHFDSLNKEEK